MSDPEKREEKADDDFFDLMVTRFLPEPKTEERAIKTVEELDECLASVLPDPMLAIGLNCVSEGGDGGSFVLLLTGERAFVHLIEGRCFTARDPTLGSQNGPRVRFQDDARVWHEVPFEETLSREQGLRALRHWMPRGEKLLELFWVPT